MHSAGISGTDSRPWTGEVISYVRPEIVSVGVTQPTSSTNHTPSTPMTPMVAVNANTRAFAAAGCDANAMRITAPTPGAIRNGENSRASRITMRRLHTIVAIVFARVTRCEPDQSM